MGSAATPRTDERVKIFETLLSSPGMNETCKVSLSPSRQAILLLAKMVENGMEKTAEKSEDILSHLPPEILAEVKAITQEMLKKGGLVDFYERLKLL